MSTWYSGDVDVNGIKLHYTRTGGDKPPLVLAHGFSDNGLCWTPVAQALESDYDVIMVDARGHGLSGGPQPGYSHADDLAEFIRALQLPKVGVIGHSMGAMTAGLLAAQYPDLVRCIILEDPPIFEETPAEAQPEPDETPGEHWIISLKTKTREEMIASGHEDNPRWSEAELEPWADSKIQFNLDVLITEPALFPSSWEPVVSQITCPALLITGDPSLRALVTPEIAQKISRLTPQGQHVYIAEAGHCIRRDQFEAFMQAVQDFLRQQWSVNA